MQPGFIIESKRTGFVARFLGNLLKLFDRSWDGWGWHLSIAWLQGYQGWIVFEATPNGQKLNFYSDHFLEKNTRSWKWFDNPPAKKDMDVFLTYHIDKPYDVAIYFWTSVGVIIRHYFNHPIPKLLDRRFSCWELVQSFTEDMGKPIVSKYDVVIITDVMKALQGAQSAHS